MTAKLRKLQQRIQHCIQIQRAEVVIKAFKVGLSFSLHLSSLLDFCPYWSIFLSTSLCLSHLYLKATLHLSHARFKKDEESKNNIIKEDKEWVHCKLVAEHFERERERKRKIERETDKKRRERCKRKKHRTSNLEGDRKRRRARKRTENQSDRGTLCFSGSCEACKVVNTKPKVIELQFATWLRLLSSCWFL